MRGGIVDRDDQIERGDARRERVNIDERVALDDLEALSLIYERALDRYFAEFG